MPAKRAAKAADVRRLPRDVKKEKIENGTLRFIDRDVHIKKQYARMFCDRCNIIGDNMNIVGDSNILYGVNNRANGKSNLKRTRAEWESVLAARNAPPPPPPPPVPEVVPPSLPDIVELPSSIGSRLANYFMSLETSVPPVRQQAPPPPVQKVDLPAEVLPDEGVDPSKSDWKRCLLDLPGEPATTTVEELRCIVCYDFRFDTIFLPCKHIICCRKCARTLYNPEKPTLCPQCRRKIESSSIVF